MATYAIGDLQGCFKSLEALLKKIDFSESRDTLWFVGDLVNRGPQSLECLRFVKDLGAAAHCVLGNHDIFLILCAHQTKSPQKGDTIADVLNAPDCAELIAWLQKQPLLFENEDFAMVHAGLLPTWNLTEARARARAVENALQNDPAFLKHVWGSDADTDSDALDAYGKLRFSVNVFTRMRFLKKANGGLDFDFKGEIPDAPPELIPWFYNRKPDEKTLITGHWSALGLQLTPRWIALDTGCLWGRTLTAIRLPDRSVFQTPCQETFENPR